MPGGFGVIVVRIVPQFRSLQILVASLALVLSCLVAAASSIPPDYKLEKLEYGAKASTNKDFQRGHQAFKKGDVNKAIEWFRKAADAGDVKAQTNVGILYLFGYSLLEDGTQIENGDALALKYFTLAAEHGDAAAYQYIGYMHDPQMTGGAEPVSIEEALKWYRKSAELGHAAAKDDLIAIYASDGFFNLKEALRWTDWAPAYKGNAEAQYNLAQLYWRASYLDGELNAKGFNTQHQIDALKWLTIVRANHNKKLVQELEGEGSFLHGMLSDEMTAADKATAEKLARKCLSSHYKDCKGPA